MKTRTQEIQRTKVMPNAVCRSMQDHSVGRPMKISHSATCECLSNRKEYPSFFRTIASDRYQSRALAQMVKHFGWTWVGAVNSDSDYGNNGMAIFLAAAQEEGVCVEYTEKFHRAEPEKLMKVVEVIRKSTARVIVGFLAHVEMNNLLEKLTLYNITGLQFIGVEAWITANSLVTPTSFRVLGGSLGFAMQKTNISGLGDFLIKDFWDTEFKCKETNRDTKAETVPCKANQDLMEFKYNDDDVEELRYSNNIYRAIYAVAHSLHSILKCSESQGCDRTIEVTPWQVVESLKQVNFTTNNGDQVWFDSTGAAVARYLATWDSFRTIGNSFRVGVSTVSNILSSHWRMYWRAIELQPEIKEKCIKAPCVLHNFLRRTTQTAVSVLVGEVEQLPDLDIIIQGKRP
ncbi:Extracellular calcium-sensing receptor [Liparis tanakae]|uniref:Extracellular calcium-sensing receptor n=1 Tax=Liparis tanakae TaxID=230148 RepID=A0A4Z2GSX7_9TELE|nr:Extracellular calcium-sensing receptor [Liparis tanakae]